MYNLFFAKSRYSTSCCIDFVEVSKQVTLNCNYFKYDMCSGYTFFDESRKVIGISFRQVSVVILDDSKCFRGTGDTIQLIIEIQNILFEDKVDFQDGGKTSKYFNDAFMDVSRPIPFSYTGLYGVFLIRVFYTGWVIQVWNGGLADDFDVLRKKYPDFTVWV